MTSIIVAVLLFSFVMVMPVKWAASFADAGRNDFIACFCAVIAASVLAVIAYRLALGGFNGFCCAYVAMLISYALVLRIPLRTLFGFAVVLLALQGLMLLGLYSFGRDASVMLSGTF